MIRPGAANEGKKLAFTRRYQGMEPITYPHPSLEKCLRSTYGLVVYEEHILQISEAFAGLNPGRADVLRRALNKQNRPMIEKIRASSSNRRGRADIPRKRLKKCGAWSRALPDMPSARRIPPPTVSKRINPRGSKNIIRSNSWRRCCPTAKGFIIPLSMCWNAIAWESRFCRRPSTSPGRYLVLPANPFAFRFVTSKG